jgi:hypothetical protein
MNNSIFITSSSIDRVRHHSIRVRAALGVILVALFAISASVLVDVSPAAAISPSISPSPLLTVTPAVPTILSKGGTATPAALSTLAPLPTTDQALGSFVPGADQTCNLPLHGWSFIDPSLSAPLSPDIDVWYDNFRFGGRSIDAWGNGKVGVANMDQRNSNGSKPEHEFQPQYTKAGTYLTQSVTTDGCNRTVVAIREVTVPIVLPAVDSVACPGELAQGVCLVDGDKSTVFSVSGPDAAGGWNWTIFGSGDLFNSSSVQMTLPLGDVTYIQATKPAPNGGSIVTPILPVTGRSLVAPQIIIYSDPGTVNTGDKVDLSFVPPAGFGTGSPTISIDGQVVVSGTDYEASWDSPGSHSVDYAYAIPGRITSSANATIIVVSPADWFIPLLIVLIVVLLLVVLILVLWIRAEWRNMRRRRMRARRRKAREARLMESDLQE